MATLKKTDSRLREDRRTASPFFARAYGGFTREQESFYLRHLGSVHGRRILDPMAGQGYTLSTLSWTNAEVWLGDINPAPLHLAMLRDPRMVLDSERLISWFKSWFAEFKPRRRASRQTEYCDDWISPAIQEGLSRFVGKLGLSPRTT